VCCKELDFYAVGACGHNDMCLYCACRLRMLQKSFDCPICKVHLPHILITTNPNARLDSYPSLDSASNEYGIICEGQEAQQALGRVNSYNCWLCKGPKAQNRTQAHLKKHLEQVHKKKFCEICLKSRILFVWEQKLYKFNEIKSHKEKGDSGEIPPHPKCLFCNKHYYDTNELKSHLEAHHYSCSLCESQYLYYENYDKLKTHFMKAHYMCHDPLCSSTGFAVFRTPYDLQAHTMSVHMKKEFKGKTVQMSLHSEEPQYENTEALDFSSQFNKKQKEETKSNRPQNKKNKKNYVVKKKAPEIVDYKTLPKRPEKEVINMVKEAMDNDPKKFGQLKQLTVNYNKHQVSPEELLHKFFELVGEIQGEALFPALITTLKSQEKQEELHKEYVKHMESKGNLTSDGKCNNAFSDCTTDAGCLRALQEVTSKELERRKENSGSKDFFIHPSQLVQMAAAVDKLTEADMLKLNFIQNFGVSNLAKKQILDMLSHSNDVVFNTKLTTKYENYFLGSIDTYQLYVICKYVEMCLAKIRGLPFKEDVKLLSNWEEEKKPEEDKKEEEEENPHSWEKILMNKKPKVPVKSEQAFPSLAPPAQPAAKVVSPPKEDFPGLPAQPEFPALSTQPTVQEAQEPQETSPYNYLLDKGIKVLPSKKNKKKKGKQIIKL